MLFTQHWYQVHAIVETSRTSGHRHRKRIDEQTSWPLQSECD